MSFVNIFSSRIHGFHRQAKFSELNLFMRKTFLWMLKPAGQNHPHTEPVNLPSTQPFETPWEEFILLLNSAYVDLPGPKLATFHHFSRKKYNLYLTKANSILLTWYTYTFSHIGFVQGN